MEHTKEPWNRGFFTGDGFNICASNNGRVIGNIKNEEDTRRVVAAVNACAGISTEEMEKGLPTWHARQDDIERKIGILIQQRDELLAALETVMQYPEIRLYIGSNISKIFDAAIAKAKGN